MISQILSGGGGGGSGVVGRGALVPKGYTQFVDANGNLVAGGSVAFLVAGTQVDGFTWRDSGLTELNFNPVLLDGSGGAVIWGLGNYQMVVYDAAGAELWSEPTFCAPPVVYLTDTGAQNALVVSFPGMLTNPPSGFNPMSQLDGINLFVIPAYTNNGAATITVEGAGATSGTTVPITYPGGGPLLGGELPAGALVPITWTGSEMQLLVASSAAGQFTSGMLMAYGGVTIPSGWLLCYGQAVSRTTYQSLFNALGSTWGAGDGSTTFNLPDLRGRALYGVDAMGGTAANRLTSASLGAAALMGVSGGDELTGGAVPTITVNDPGHLHTFPAGYSYYSGSPPGAASNGATTAIFYANKQTATATTGITVTLTGTNTGTSENLPPAAVIQWMIKV